MTTRSQSLELCQIECCVSLWHCFVQEGDAVCTMYENDGLISTEDGNILIWAGSTVGGGTRINWYTLC